MAKEKNLYCVCKEVHGTSGYGCKCGKSRSKKTFEIDHVLISEEIKH
jgi:hypothetical protein